MNKTEFYRLSQHPPPGKLWSNEIFFPRISRIVLILILVLSSASIRRLRARKILQQQTSDTTKGPMVLVDWRLG
jgi:hypothetical protein